MKKLLLTGALLLFATGVWAAPGPPANNSIIDAAVTTTTVSADWTGVWKFVDSLAVLKTDTCYAYFTVTGTATLYRGDKLYIGMGVVDDAAAAGDTTVPATDTLIIEWPLNALLPSHVFNFGMSIKDSLVSQTDSTSRCFLTAAVKSSSSADAVIITTSTLSCAIIDVD